MSRPGAGVGPSGEVEPAGRATAVVDASPGVARRTRPVAGATILDHAALGVEQRILVSSDATVVRLLEGCFEETIRTAGLAQVRTPARMTDAELELRGDETILRRETLLQGGRTGRNYVYAQASIVLDRLAPGLREALLSTSEPIGNLLVANRVETFRELLRVGRTPAGPLGEPFGLESSDELLFRTYRLTLGGQPAMLITERFPLVFFRGLEEES